jgi:hypothetical protein
MKKTKEEFSASNLLHEDGLLHDNHTECIGHGIFNRNLSSMKRARTGLNYHTQLLQHSVRVNFLLLAPHTPHCFG